MSEYVQRFAENDIDFSTLPGLTDQDLEKIGVARLPSPEYFRAIAVGEHASGEVGAFDPVGLIGHRRRRQNSL